MGDLVFCCQPDFSPISWKYQPDFVNCSGGSASVPDADLFAAKGVCVSKSSSESGLADLRDRTIILRLVLDKRGLIVHGELIDLEGNPIDRFVGWRGLTRVMRNWLQSQT